MTDFLHPQSIPTSEPLKDVSITEPVVLESAESQEDQSSQPSQVPQTSNQDQSNHSNQEVARKNFATARDRKKTVPEELNEDHEGVKKIVRKESQLFISYYQSVFLLLIALFVVSGYFVLNPLITEFKKTNESISVGLKSSEDAQAYLDSLNRSIKAAQSISPETLSRVNEALPKDVDVLKLLKTFNQIADQNHVTMSGVTVSPPQGASGEGPSYGGYALVPVQISLSVQASGYQVMRKYLEDLQTNIRLMDVKTISVSGDDSTGAFTYSLELTTYAIQKSVAPPSSSIPGAGTPGMMPAPAAPGANSGDT